MIRTYSSQEHIEQLNVAVKCENLTVEYKGRPNLLNINMEVPSGVLLAVLGPNNSGKTTLLKAIAGIEKPAAGNVYIYSRPTHALKNDVAYVPERNFVNWDFPINLFDLVLMGSYNRLKRAQQPHKKDKVAVKEALERMGLEKLARKSICDLSRGEKHRALIARALVQDARIYIMDEPMVAADEESINIIVEVLQELRAKKKTVIVSHHDFVTIPKYFDMVALLNVKLLGIGKTEDILTEENFEKTYGMSAGIIKNIRLHMEKSHDRNK